MPKSTPRSISKPLPEFVAFLVENLAALALRGGEVTARSMFGGYGIYWRKKIIAIVAWDTLYFKATNALAAEFTRLGCEMFVYDKDGKPFNMRYYRAPEECLDDADVLCAWALRVYEAAYPAHQ